VRFLCIQRYVVTPGSPSLAEVLRSTLKRLEQNEDLASDDPALNELKGTILRAITELEVGKTPRPSAQQRILWITPRPHQVEMARIEVAQVNVAETEVAQAEVLPAPDDADQQTLAETVEEGSLAAAGKVSTRKTRTVSARRP
jgi:esterase/lipase superfamily enzyme